MPAPTNLGFETDAGTTPGQALGWTTTSQSSIVSIAHFAASQGAESFEAWLAVFDASHGPANGQFYVLPSWMTLTCPTVGRTSQVSANTLVVGYSADAARGRNIGLGWGLSAESSRQNVNHDAASPGGTGSWVNNVALTIVTGQADPSGGAAAVSATATAVAEYIQAAGSVGAGVDFVQSVWAKQGIGGTAAFRFAGGDNYGPATPPLSTWSRFDFPDHVTAAGGWLLDPGRAALTAITLWGSQQELGKYPSSFIPTTVAAVTRAADVISISPDVAPGGYFSMLLNFAPNYATAEQGVDHDLLYFDANNRLFLRQADHKIVLRLGGVDTVSAALTWSREQELALTVVHGSGGCSLQVSGATTGNGTTIGAAQPAIALPAAIYVLGNAGGCQECADLRLLAFPTLQLAGSFAPAAQFAVGLLLPAPGFEGFEAGWSSNQNYSFSLTSSASATFTGGALFDDFTASATLWYGATYLTSFSALVGVNTAPAAFSPFVVGSTTRGNPDIVTTTLTSDIAAGEIVVIAGVANDAAANGTFRAQNVVANTFELHDPNTNANIDGGVGIAGAGGTVRVGRENFEMGWPNNTAYLTSFNVGVDTSPALFDLGAHAFENFETRVLDKTYTVDPTTDVFTSVGHGMANGTRLHPRNQSGGLVPTPLNKQFLYFVINTAANTFQLSLTLGGGVLDITDAGTGTNMVHGDPLAYWTSDGAPLTF